MFGLFNRGRMKCIKCGAERKKYPDFESQWTAILVEGEMTKYVCPRCWGILDPAPLYCLQNGHDFHNGKCDRCGTMFRIADNN